MSLNELTIQEAHAGLVDRAFSAVELAQACLDRIEERNNDIHAFLEVWPEQAMAQAEAVDAIIADGEDIGPLAGIPLAVKDNICIAGTRTTAGSRMLEHYTAPYTATVMQRLQKEHVVVLGKTNLDEFAMGASTEHSAFGPTRNPHDRERVPGGSSGGSAAAVADGMCLAALGSDTGGSIRQPAAFCGVVGLKPSYGRVSRHGLIAMGSSLDQIGPLARDVDGARRLYDVIHGPDDLDTTTAEFADDDRDLPASLDGIRIGIPQEYFGEGLTAAVQNRVQDAIDELEEAGAVVEKISLPHTEAALATYYIITPAEVSANLARYDNLRYDGLDDTVEAAGLAAFYRAARSRGLGDEVRRRIMLGTYTLSAGYYDAYYGRAQRVRALIRDDFDKAFASVDVIATPTTPTTAFRLGDKADDPLQMYLSDIFTVTANLAGIPGISLPLAGDDLPVGLQLLGPHGADAHLLAVAEHVA